MFDVRLPAAKGNFSPILFMCGNHAREGGLLWRVFHPLAWLWKPRSRGWFVRTFAPGPFYIRGFYTHEGGLGLRSLHKDGLVLIPTTGDLSIMTQHIEELKKIAKRLGAELVPLEIMDSHLLAITGMGNMGRFTNKRLEKMTEDELRQAVEDASTLPETTPLVFVGMKRHARYKSHPYYVEAKS